MAQVKVELPSGHHIRQIVPLADNKWLALVAGDMPEGMPGPPPVYCVEVNGVTGDWDRITDYPDIRFPQYAGLVSNRDDAAYVICASPSRYVPSLESPYQFDYSVNALALSPDELFLYAGTTDGLYVYYRGTVNDPWGVETVLLPDTNIAAVDVNPAGTHIAVGATTNTRVTVFKRAGTSFTELFNIAGTNSCQGIKYSPNGEYLAIGRNLFPRATFYKIDGDDYTLLSFSSTAPTGIVYGVAWSPSNDYVVFVHASSPYISIYERDGDTFTKLANPATIPNSTCWCADFAPDDSSLLVGSQTSPFVWRYDHDGEGTFVRNTSIASVTPVNTRTIKFSQDGTKVYIGANTTSNDAHAHVRVWSYDSNSYTNGVTFFAPYQLQVRALAVGASDVYVGSWDYPSFISYQSCITTYKLPPQPAQGVCRSDDGGRTWQFLYDFEDEPDVNWWYTNDSPLAAHDDTVYCGITIDMQSNTTFGGAVYKSTDRGDTWTRVYDTEADYPDPEQDGVDLTAIQAKPNGHVVVALHTYDDTTGDYAVTSLDSGATWGGFALLPTAPVWVSTIGYTDNIWFTSGEGYIRRSLNNGGSWSRVLIPGVVNYIRNVSSGHPTIAAVANPDDDAPTTSGVLISQDDGATWENSFVSYPVHDSDWPSDIAYHDGQWAYAVNNEIYFRSLIEGIAPPDSIEASFDIEVLAPVAVGYAVPVASTAHIRDATSTEFQRAIEVASSSQAVADATLAIVLLGSDTLEAAAAAEYIEAVNILVRLRAASEFDTFTQAVRSILDTLQVVATGTVADAVAVVDLAVEAADALEVTLTRFADALDAVEASVESVATLKLSIALFDDQEVTAETEVLAHLQANLSDALFGYVVFRFADEVHTGWVMNTEGQRPLSEYDNFNFNSFCKVGSTYYAAADTGLYILEGDTDFGEPIDAALATMMLDFGSPALKRVQAAYIGYTANGRLLLKVRAVSEGVLQEHWFEAKDLPADAPREQMVRLGRGARSRYWQFELVNVDGAEFEISTMELHPVYLNRRV